MDFDFMHSIWTVVMFVLFIGIVAWAWSAKRKRRFDEAARMPLEDDDDVTGGNKKSGDKKHG
ncbi:MAG: cbb3-type cytochrome c oxidase subunit 3 [Gammaproteobacteria bacterium]|nr:cbb3-type cytochrome c oxidase subunit 3 [Gammaproteobacteria bacterium]